MAARNAQNAPYDFLIKLLIIGDGGVGKSHLLLRFSDDAFTSASILTIGIDFKIKTIDLDGKRIKLQIWDIGNNGRFRTVTTSYYRGTMGILLVYDITDEQSFENVRIWLNIIEQHAAQDVSKVLIGNKCDMEADRQVDTARAQRLADEYGVQLFEVSAKDDINVTEAFTHIAKDIKRRLMDSAQHTIADTAQHVDVDDSRDKPKKGCC